MFEYATLVRRRGFKVADTLAPAATRKSDENELLSSVRKLAKMYGWMSYHTHDPRRSDEGFPDLVMVRESIIFAELKSRTGKLSHAQEIWLRMLERTGSVEVYLWRPQDLDMIAARLSRRTLGGGSHH